MDEQVYLEPGFDPASLTMPRLRSILVAHSVSYPSSAKKSELIVIFNERVLPLARKIRNANARTVRSSRGIVDVPSSQASVAEEEAEEAASPPPPDTGRRTSRRTTRAKTEDLAEVTPRVANSAARRSGSKHARPSEAAEEEPEPKRPVSRKSRQSAVTPGIKLEQAEDDGDSPFSVENPFQSGSSPPPAPRSRSKERRRTTLGPAKDTDWRKNREVRRRTDDYKAPRSQADGVVVPTRRTFEMPIARIKKGEDVEPSEEFTPEEQQDLIKAEQTGELVPTRRKTKPKSTGVAKIAPWAVTLAMFGGLATFWRQEKIEVGYCGVGRPSTEIGGFAVPDWAELIRPQCEPCPQHAYCYPNLKTECEQGFVMTNSPLSFNGIIPLPPTCEPDSQKMRKVKAVKERAVEELRVQNAKYECGEVNTPEVEESELKEAISTKRRKGMTNEDFEELWAGALGELQGADEVVSGADGRAHLTLRSTSLARLPLSCAVRRSLRETLRQYIWKLVALLLLVSSGAYTRQTITSGRETEAKAKELASNALNLLAQQAALHKQDPGVWAEGYVSVAQLRDDVLRDEFSSSRRKKLWVRVQQKVEGNANVRPMVKAGRTGDVGRMWEWIGAVGAIESPPDRRRSGRVSLGGIAGDDRLIIATGSTGDGVESSQVSKWEEGRRYF